ncbi:hypothetical protein MtrunA17_Chr7g0227681 [Medicago truncatula]|uniref:Transmembrane protein n=1 Tax=Medicago truncatula TaxID=3880 RepID=A0A396GVY6_MEDTR|nr:hypothetical protein MtrunA17_Chr7g0227681 [Medicago truncatula]
MPQLISSCLFSISAWVLAILVCWIADSFYCFNKSSCFFASSSCFLAISACLALKFLCSSMTSTSCACITSCLISCSRKVEKVLRDSRCLQISLQNLRNIFRNFFIESRV